MIKNNSSRQNLAEIIDYACNDSGIYLVNTREEVYSTCINSTNKTNDISMNDDDKFSINIMHNFYCQIAMKMYLQQKT